jgi:hypothetical protein
VLQAIAIIPFDEKSVDTAVTINSALKKKSKQIDLPTYLLRQLQLPMVCL